MPLQETLKRAFTFASLTDEEAVQLYHWLNVPRIATVVLMTASIVYFWALGETDFEPGPVIFGLVPIFVIATGMVDLLIRRKFRPQLLLYIQLAIDLMGATAGILITGGIRSPFTLLYVLVIISAGAVSAATAISFGALASLLYGALAYLDRLGGVPTAPGMTMSHAQGDTISITIFLLLICLVAFQSQFYVRRIREKDEELLKLKDEFMFRAVHDLRAPTIIIRLTLDAYRERPEVHAIAPTFNTDMERVQGALDRITNLIEDLLKIANGESVALLIKKEKVDMTALIRRVVADFGPVMEKKRVTAEIAAAQDLPNVLGDQEKLKEVFGNFVDNAIKYNKDGGAIFIAQRTDGAFLATEIRDTGLGISEKSLAKLFAPFFRGDIGKDIPGTGLGLYMTKRLVEKMGGKVAVRSKKGEGTAFTISLPLA